MLERWGRVVYRRRRLVLVISLLAVVFAAVWGTGVFSKLQSSGGFTPANSESQQASNLATAAFGRDAGDVVVLYSSPDQAVRSPGFRSSVTSTLADLPRGQVLSYQTYWSTKSPQFISASGRETYAVLELAGADDAARIKSFDAIKGDLAAPGLQTQIGGFTPTEQAINKQVTADIGRAEGFSMPVLLIVMLIIFGSLAAASLPLAIGGIAILGSFTALRLLTLGTTVSIYSINITTILGLGLAIDYGLFLVSRFREELRGQPTVEDAVARTVATAGRTVAVSGITVATALASLMLFPETFLRSMGYGGVATVLVDMLAALTVLPALLAVLGPRVNALRVRRAAGGPARAEQSGGWYRLARSVMRRPVVYVVVIVAALLVLAAPFRHITWGGTDARALPAGAPARVVTEALNRDFPGNPASPIEVLARLDGPVSAPAPRGALASYVQRLAHVPGISAVQVTGLRGDAARLDLRYAADPSSVAARHLVTAVRAVPAPAGSHVYVGGVTAQLVDELASLGHILPWMALVICLATFVLLFLAFGSVVLPVKAIAMNVASLSATFGVIVWIFQEGHLSGLLQFTPTGSIDPAMPILLLAIVFGLSMDYEVFLLSRIRERYDVTGDNTAAIASGLQRTGGLITSLALMLVVVVGAFSASGIVFIKLLGVGMIVALIVDATIVRVLLVPATMRLLGRLNWWAPGPLARVQRRFGIREEGAGRPAPESARSAAPVPSRPRA
ncbi:MAG TPA: MMPL family transporter [Streptosporangiaceae bacterium]|nr:MMPL family transporter [Streptosporangiaceae bacterium]